MRSKMLDKMRLKKKKSQRVHVMRDGSDSNRIPRPSSSSSSARLPGRTWTRPRRERQRLPAAWTYLLGDFWRTPAIIGALWAVSLLWYISLAAVAFQRCWSVVLANYFSVVRACGAASSSDDRRGFVASKYLKKTCSRDSSLFFLHTVFSYLQDGERYAHGSLHTECRLQWCRHTICACFCDTVESVSMFGPT